MGRRVSCVPALVVAGVLLVGATGCDANPAPGALPSEPVPSAGRLWQSAPPTAPAMPVAAKGTGPRAAKAFVRHWIDSLNYAARSGDTSGLRASSSPRCAACSAIARFIDRVYAHGGSIKGDGWQLLETNAVGRAGRKQKTIDALVRVRPQVVFNDSAAAPKRYQGGRRLKTFWLSRSGSGWLIERLEQPE